MNRSLNSRDVIFKDVSKSFLLGKGRVHNVIADVDLNIHASEFVCIVGPSGCGKTTLLRMAAGLEKPDTGSVVVGGEVVVAPSPTRVVVFQHFALFPWLNVWGNIEYGLKCIGISRDERASRVRDYIGRMRLDGREDAYPKQLSGGMQQRVALARAYVMKPPVLLMDEPFGALDALMRQQLQGELLEMKRSDPTTVVFVTHSVDEAVLLGDRIVVMSSNPAKVRTVLDMKKVRDSGSWDTALMTDIVKSQEFTEVRTMLLELLLGSDGVLKRTPNTGRGVECSV